MTAYLFSIPMLRPATTQDVTSLATIWHESWHEAHAHLVPPELTALRTLPSFLERLPALVPDVTVAERDGVVIGFCGIEHDELFQLFVSRAARGTGAAQSLVADAEARLRGRGVETAWLSCAIGNDRAARFYEKCGWTRVGNMVNPAHTPTGPFMLETWRYEKRLVPPGEGASGE